MGEGGLHDGFTNRCLTFDGFCWQENMMSNIVACDNPPVVSISAVKSLVAKIFVDDSNQR